MRGISPPLKGSERRGGSAAEKMKRKLGKVFLGGVKKRVQEGKNQGRPYRGHMRFHLSLLLTKKNLDRHPFFFLSFASLPSSLPWLSSCS
jgi:hypothetical protein